MVRTSGQAASTVHIIYYTDSAVMNKWAFGASDSNVQHGGCGGDEVIHLRGGGVDLKCEKLKEEVMRAACTQTKCYREWKGGKDGKKFPSLKRDGKGKLRRRPQPKSCRPEAEHSVSPVVRYVCMQ